MDKDNPLPLDRAMLPVGALYRVSPDDQAHLVASGFYRPRGIAFIGGSIWIADHNGDF